MREIVKPLGPHQERRGELAGVDVVVAVGDDTLLEKFDDTVGEHLRMDAQILLAA